MKSIVFCLSSTAITAQQWSLMYSSMELIYSFVHVLICIFAGCTMEYTDLIKNERFLPSTYTIYG